MRSWGAAARGTLQLGGRGLGRLAGAAPPGPLLCCYRDNREVAELNILLVLLCRSYSWGFG